MTRLLLVTAVVMFSTFGHTQPALSNTALNLQPVVSSATALQPAKASTSLTTTAATTTPVASSKPPVLPASLASSQSCTPNHNDAATPVALDNAAPGLTQTIQPTNSYQIYGTSASGLRDQISRCAPTSSVGQSSSEFAGETSYYLSSAYDIVDNSDGLCTLGNIRVGLDVVVTLPSWQPTPSAPTSLVQAWNAFMAGITTHEQGHVVIDEQYANQFLHDLEAFPEGDCGLISAQVQAISTADTAATTAANNAYDQRTNHGALQGAVLPS